MMFSTRLVLMMLLVACNTSQEPMAETRQLSSVDDLLTVWTCRVEYAGDWKTLFTRVTNTSSYPARYAELLAAAHSFCDSHSDAECRTAEVSFNVEFKCPPEWGVCTSIPAKVGWVPYANRLASTQDRQVRYLKDSNVRAEWLKGTLENHGSTQRTLQYDAETLGRNAGTLILDSTTTKLTTLGSAVRSAEQIRLAQTRKTVLALEAIIATYESALQGIQSSYGEVAAQHKVYRATESAVFAALEHTATAASTSGIDELQSLKLMLTAHSTFENSIPQVRIREALRVRWELARIQASYEQALTPYADYLTAHSIATLDHTSTPRLGVDNVISYANKRMERVNDAVRGIYEGIRRRESALQLAAADAATREQIRATSAANREADFLNEITTRIAVLWKQPEKGALDLPLQGERLREMTAFKQLTALCSDMNGVSNWRVPGCQKIGAEAAKVHTYLTQTIPFVLKFGVQKMRAAAYDEARLVEIETFVREGSLVQAVHSYDAILRTAKES